MVAEHDEARTKIVEMLAARENEWTRKQATRCRRAAANERTVDMYLLLPFLKGHASRFNTVR